MATPKADKKLSTAANGRVFFKNNQIYLPVTMKQFEELVNDILAALNFMSNEEEKGFTADYVAQVVMSAIHAMKHEVGTTTKQALFESTVNRISCHVTYHVVEEIQKKLKAEAGVNPDSELGTAPAQPVSQDEAPPTPTQ